jgi:hypothetical protein
MVSQPELENWQSSTAYASRTWFDAAGLLKLQESLFVDTLHSRALGTA